MADVVERVAETLGFFPVGSEGGARRFAIERRWPSSDATANRTFETYRTCAERILRPGLPSIVPTGSPAGDAAPPTALP